MSQRYTAGMTLPANKPLAALTEFAAILGWLGLRIYHHRCPQGDDSILTTWYESGVAEGGRSDLFLQFNEIPTGQSLTYVGAVYAMRFRICSGWHPFTLYDDARMVAEATRMECWLHREWFETVAMRREYRRLHPECADYSWQRIRESGPPYDQHRHLAG